MKLQTYLDKLQKSRTWFGEQFVPPVTASTINGWCADKPTMPQKRYREQIVAITKGKVTMKDFV